MSDKLYHIYIQNNCIYHSLTYEQFNEAWTMLNHLVEVIGTYNKNDISYEEVTVSKEICLNSSY